MTESQTGGSVPKTEASVLITEAAVLKTEAFGYNRRIRTQMIYLIEKQETENPFREHTVTCLHFLPAYPEM